MHTITSTHPYMHMYICYTKINFIQPNFLWTVLTVSPPISTYHNYQLFISEIMDCITVCNSHNIKDNKAKRILERATYGRIIMQMLNNVL